MCTLKYVFNLLCRPYSHHQQGSPAYQCRLDGPRSISKIFDLLDVKDSYLTKLFEQATGRKITDDLRVWHQKSPLFYWHQYHPAGYCIA